MCYERFAYQTTACNEILLDWFDLSQQPDELCLSGKFGGSGARPTLSCFGSRFSIFETIMGVVYSRDCDRCLPKKFLFTNAPNFEKPAQNIFEIKLIPPKRTLKRIFADCSTSVFVSEFLICLRFNS